MMNKHKSMAKIFLIGALFFVIVLTACEFAMVFIINNYSQDLGVESYVITLIIMPICTLGLTLTLISVLYVRSQKTARIIYGLEKVASGDYDITIDYNRSDSFRDIYRNFNLMTTELRASKTMREDFVRDLSHEIKTPLSSIAGFAELIYDGGLTKEEERKYLKIISEEADRLKKLAESTLLLTKIEHESFGGKKSEFRLDTQINECIIIFNRDWEKKSINFSATLAPISVYADKSMLGQIWINLLSNAVKFTPENGNIEVSLKGGDGLAKVVVKNSGTKIDESELGQIFDKYYRGKNNLGKDGNGMGLAICKQICQMCGGDIFVRNVEDGVEFGVNLIMHSQKV